MVEKYGMSMEKDKWYGEWVKYEDYEDLESEKQELEKQVEKLEDIIDELKYELSQYDKID